MKKNNLAEHFWHGPVPFKDQVENYKYFIVFNSIIVIAMFLSKGETTNFLTDVITEHMAFKNIKAMYTRDQ